MRNLIRADISRVLKRPLIYVALITSLLAYLFSFEMTIANEFVNSASYLSGIKKAMDNSGLIFIITIAVFIAAVFSNELKAKSMQVVIGHGLTRGKLITAKFLDGIIIVCLYFIVFTAVGLMALYSSGNAASDQAQMVLRYTWMCAYRIGGYVIFSAAIMFLTSSSTLGAIAAVAFSLLIENIMEIIDELTEVRFFDYTFDGLINEALLRVDAHLFGWQVIPALLYIAFALALTIFFFNRKEFDF